jgi:hypothetical protein
MKAASYKEAHKEEMPKLKSISVRVYYYTFHAPRVEVREEFMSL